MEAFTSEIVGKGGMTMTKIDIISGFLGAGKTTLIKKLIEDSLANEKLVLIENEFGEIGIDGGFLKEAGVQVTEMNSGCICCSLVGDFGASLREVVETYHPDRILIEPSGVGKLTEVVNAKRKEKKGCRQKQAENSRQPTILSLQTDDLLFRCPHFLPGSRLFSGCLFSLGQFDHNVGFDRDLLHQFQTFGAEYLIFFDIPSALHAIHGHTSHSMFLLLYNKIFAS